MGLKKTHSPDPLHEVVERAHPRDAQGLLTQLREGDIEQRRWAARDLAGQHTAVVAMGERLLAEPEPRVREALFTTLTGMPTEATVTVLLPLLRSEDASLRNGAIEALAAMPRAVARASPRCSTTPTRTCASSPSTCSASCATTSSRSGWCR